MDEKKRIEELVKTLNEASEAYYNGQDEIMSNYEWDGMFDELTRLEEKTGYILPESPTQNAGFEESNGEREAHEYPALSLPRQNGFLIYRCGREKDRSGYPGNWMD